LDKVIYLYNSDLNTLEHFQTFKNNDINVAIYPLRTDIIVFGLKRYGRVCVYKFDPDHGKYSYLTKPHIKQCSSTNKDQQIDMLKWHSKNPEMLYVGF